MILREPIQFEPKETVYIWVNYINLPKRCSFVIMTMYLIVIYIVLDNNILKIIILTNPIKKRLEFNKNIRLEIIYKYVDTTYIITNIIKAFVIMAITSSILSDPFFTV